MSIDLIIRFAHGMITGGLAVLLIWNLNQIKRLKRQKEIMYKTLDSIAKEQCFEYDPDATIPDDYNGMWNYCRVARATNRILVSTSNIALTEINRLDGRNS